MCRIGVYRIGWWVKGFIRLFCIVYCIVLLCFFLCILHSLWVWCCSLSKWLHPKKGRNDCLLLHITSVLFIWHLSSTLCMSCTYYTYTSMCVCVNTHTPMHVVLLSIYKEMFICLFIFEHFTRFCANQEIDFNLSRYLFYTRLMRTNDWKRVNKQAGIHGANSSYKLLSW